MKSNLLSPKTQTSIILAAFGALGLVGPMAYAAERVEREVTVVGADGAGGGTVTVAERGEPKVIEIRRVIQAEDGAGEGKEVAWLGLGTDEANEVLASQLNLKGGQGLVVNYVGPDSPAAKAGLQKNDVLLELDGQILVLPAQLRKLVQGRKEGDEINLTILRSGQKQQLKATLGKTKPGVASLGEGTPWMGNLQDLGRHFRELRLGDQLGEGMKQLRESLAQAGVDKDSIRIEVRKGIEEARKAVDEALRGASNGNRTHIITADRVLKDLKEKGISIDNNASVTVQSTGREVRTLVKTDETGTMVLVADPRKRLTAHDKTGKLVFDGELESKEQTDKVPASIRDRVKEMLEELDKVKVPPAAEAEHGEESAIPEFGERNS
jgi:membrane-associated protease RseP (regulator of RpoE activity)